MFICTIAAIAKRSERLEAIGVVTLSGLISYLNYCIDWSIRYVWNYFLAPSIKQMRRAAIMKDDDVIEINETEKMNRTGLGWS